VVIVVQFFSEIILCCVISNRTRAAFRPNCTPLSSITIINHGLGFTLISRIFFCRGGFSLHINTVFNTFSVFNCRSRQRTTLRYSPSLIPKKRQLFIHKVFISSRRRVFFQNFFSFTEAAERFKRGKGAHPPLPLRCSLAKANFFQSFTVTTSICHNASVSCSGGPASWCFLGCC